MTDLVSRPSVSEALRWAGEQLAQTSESDLSARLLLSHVLDATVTDLFVHPERVLTGEQDRAYRALVARRVRHEPMAYLVGHRPFLDLDLLVDERVLIPRPETERLVELALDVAQRWPAPLLADVGTGSGAIAVSLAVHLPQALVYAIDCSVDALDVSRENARRYNVDDRVVTLRGDLLAPLPEPVHLIVANLPYVAEPEAASLPPDVRAYEPPEALFAGQDGLSAIRALLDTARSHLLAGAVLLLEIGAGQGRAVTQLAACAYPDAQIDLLPDYAGHDRILRIDLAP